MARTVYSKIENSIVRAYCLYSVTETNTDVTVSGTIALQHKGAAYSNEYLPYSAVLFLGDYTQIKETSEVFSFSKHTDWTTIKSSSFSYTRTKTTNSLTITFNIGVGILSGQEYTAPSSSTSFSVSIPALKTYSVTYNANGGSGAPSSQTKTYGKTLTLSSVKPTRTNYSFYHWNTASNNTGTSYSAGASYTGNAALSLYAIWNPKISYNANGGSGAPSTQTKTYGTNLTLTTSKPTRTNYSFYHWNTTSNNTGTSYSPGATYSSNTATTLYAIWNPIISFDANGGTGAPSAQTKTYGTNLTLSSTRPTKAYATFVEWNTKSDGTGTRYLPGATYSSNTATTLYAIWQLNSDLPTITSMTAIRWDFTNNVQKEDSTSAKVEVPWYIDTSLTNSATVTLRVVGPTGSTAPTITSISGTSGTSGSAIFRVDGIELTNQYVCTVTVTDQYSSSSRSAYITKAYFIFDFKAGGEAVGFGRIAPASGLEVGYDTVFDGDVTVNGRFYMTTYWGDVYCTYENSVSTSSNYFPLCINGAQIATGYSHKEVGFIHGRTNMTISEGNTRYNTYFKVPEGVSVVEVSMITVINHSDSTARRYSAAVCISKDLTATPTSSRTLGGVLTTTLNTYYYITGSTILSVKPGDFIFLRGYKASSDSSQSIYSCNFTIKAIG